MGSISKSPLKLVQANCAYGKFSLVKRPQTISTSIVFASGWGRSSAERACSLKLKEVVVGVTAVHKAYKGALMLVIDKVLLDVDLIHHQSNISTCMRMCGKCV